MKMRFILTFSILVLITAIFCSFLPVNGEAEVYSKTVRLHVLANSDSIEDQELKLQVRDTVVQLVEGYVADCMDKESAVAVIESKKDEIKSAAEACILEEGYSYSVTVETGPEKYPTRSYESVSLPAGIYYSLRVKIGEAQGANWWCVLYPPLCVNSAKAKELLVEAGFTGSQIRLLTESDDPKYILKFRILEVFGALADFFG